MVENKSFHEPDATNVILLEGKNILPFNCCTVRDFIFIRFIIYVRMLSK